MRGKFPLRRHAAIFPKYHIVHLPRCKKVKKKKKEEKKAKFLNDALQKNCYYHKFCIHCLDMRD